VSERDNIRPHPGPLPQEREKGRPLIAASYALDCCAPNGSAYTARGPIAFPLLGERVRVRADIAAPLLAARAGNPPLTAMKRFGRYDRGHLGGRKTEQLLRRASVSSGVGGGFGGRRLGCDAVALICIKLK
jgi:hypothetical protein